MSGPATYHVALDLLHDDRAGTQMAAERTAADAEADFLCAIGGSSLAAYRSPLSDVDYFVVAPAARMAEVTRAYCPGTGAGRDKVDVESRDILWLERFLAELDGFEARLNGGPSALDLWDMRFAARILLGRRIGGSPLLLQRLEARADLLRRALAGFYSSFFIATYEDALGLCLAGRYRELPVIAGELAQRATLLSLLQADLVDPAPKWALTMATCGDRPQIENAAAALLCHLGSSLEPDPARWAKDLLRLANRVVAAGMRGACGPTEASAAGEGEAAGAANDPIGFCLMGIPGYKTLIDLRTDRIHACNDAFLDAVRRGVFPALA